MKFIVAADEEWNIGYKGNLLTYVPEDLKSFKAITSGHIVVMGRKTYESLKNKKPLPHRRNIILTRDQSLEAEGFEICHSVEEILALETTSEEKEVFIIGGAKIYSLFLPYCEEAYVTKLQGVYPADTRLFNLDEEEDWALSECGEVIESSRGAKFCFTRYKRK